MTDALRDELTAARAEFLSVLDAVDRTGRDAPKLVGESSARELVAHLGYWSGHAVEMIHAVETGRVDEIGVDEPSVDERNETVARVARQADPATVRKREAASVQALLERLVLLDPALLVVRLPGGVTLENGIREDGAIHYREHADQLRAAAGDS